MNIKTISKSDMELIKRAITYLKPYRIKFFITFICILFVILFSLIQPLMWATLITDIFNKRYTNIVLNVSAIIVLYIIQIILSFIETYLFTSIDSNIVYDLKNDMYKSILELPSKAFDEIRVGEFISRLQNDTSSLANIITEKFLNCVINVLKVIIIGILVFNINFILAVTVVLFFPLSYFIFIKYGKILREKNRKLKSLNDRYISNVQETILGIKEIKSLGISSERLDIFSNFSNIIKLKIIDIGKTNAFSQSLSQATRFISQSAVLIIGIYFIFKNQLSIALFIAFCDYSAQFSNSIIGITTLNSDIQQSLASLERIFKLMDNFSYSKENFGVNKINSGSLVIVKFEKVSFSYNGNMKILENISFTIPQNKKIAIIGPSGSGKTTIFNLLLNLYKPNSGSIKMDNIDISDISEESLKSYISIVRQEPFLFNVSIKENLLMANSKATICQIEDVCKKAYIHDYIMTLPNKYETIVGENSINFSCGQKQRLAIARSLLKDSKIILLDEATSALDSESQNFIKKSVDGISKDRTVVIIAHRLSTIIDAHEIIVINNGTIIGKGNHDYLLKTSEFYGKLYKAELGL